MAGFGGFGRRGHARGGAGTTDYGAPAGRSNRAHRPAILANHWLHWSSSVIVLGISAYFIANYSHNTHLIYWITIVSFGSLPDQLSPWPLTRSTGLHRCLGLFAGIVPSHC
jgi:hypothetical protein